MKRDIAGFLARFRNCQQVKAEHQKSGALTQVINVPTWKWEHINMDFVVGLLGHKYKMNQYGLLLTGLRNMLPLSPLIILVQQKFMLEYALTRLSVCMGFRCP